MSEKYKRGTILLVEDEIINIEIVMSILKEYNIIYTKSAEEALLILPKYEFDLILLDVVMPGLDGYEFCSKIKTIEDFKNIPIIFLTVKDDEKDILKGFELGAVDYVTKPFQNEVLLKRVEVHLKLASASKDLKTLNESLNEKVKEQIKEIAEKNEMIIQQSKINAMGSVINLISSQWKKPLDKVKLYLQLLNYKLLNNEELKSDDTFEKILDQIAKLDKIMDDFHRFFNNKKNIENVNLKVSLENVVFALKDEITKSNIKINIQGNVLLSLNIVFDEIKHVFSKLIINSIEKFKISNNLENRLIDIKFETIDGFIIITYEDNAENHDDKEEANFLVNDSVPYDDFDLGFFLVKVFIEKNFGLFNIEKTQSGIKYIIKFENI